MFFIQLSSHPDQHFNLLSFRYEEKLWVRSLAGKKQESEKNKGKNNFVDAFLTAKEDHKFAAQPLVTLMKL